MNSKLFLEIWNIGNLYAIDLFISEPIPLLEDLGSFTTKVIHSSTGQLSQFLDQIPTDSIKSLWMRALSFEPLSRQPKRSWCHKRVPKNLVIRFRNVLCNFP